MLAGLLHTPIAHALSWALIHFLWEGAALAALLAAALFVFRPASARVRYGLACVALCAMLAAPAVTLSILWPRLDTGAGLLIRSGAPAAALAPASSTPGTPPAPPPDRLPWVAPFWMAGVLLFYLRTATSWAAAQRLRRRGTMPASADWQDRLRALARRLRVSRPVAMLESCLTETPAVVGFLRPAILIPAGLLTGLPPEQVEAILLHELAHIRRHDYAVNVLQTLVEGLLFYHPAVWWVSGVIRAERENCCDDAVVAAMGDARGYAAALAELEWRRSVSQPAVAARGGNLMRRIRRLLEPEGPRSIAGPVLGTAVLMASIAAGLLAWQPAAPQDTRAIQGAQLRAQLEIPYEKWLAEDVVYIITSEEQQAFKRLQTDGEREQFIEQFWLRRDPTPGTVENEFKEEHYRRIAYANDHFAESIPGWKTHRGMYYIKFGPPDEIDDHGDSNPPFLAWTYHHMQPAPGAGEATVVFTDVDGNGQFTLPKHTPASAVIMGTPPRVDVRNQTATVTFNIPSFGGPTAVAIRIETQAGATAAVAREVANPPQYAKSFQLSPGVYRIQVLVQRTGEGAIALFPRGQEFEIPEPGAGGALQPAPPDQARIDLDIAMHAMRTAQSNLAALREMYTDYQPDVGRVQAQIKALQARIDTLLAGQEPATAGAAAKTAGADVVQQRKAYADAHFAEGATAGSQTQRGRVYMAYGAPDSILARDDRQTWEYLRVTGPGARGPISFTFTNLAGTGVWVQSERQATGSHTDNQSSSPLDLKVVAKIAEIGPADSSGASPVTLSISIQEPGAGGKFAIYERITTMTRRLVQTSEETVSFAPGQAEYLYPKTVPLVPGHYRLNLVVRDTITGRVADYETMIEAPGPQAAEEKQATGPQLERSSSSSLDVKVLKPLEIKPPDPSGASPVTFVISIQAPGARLDIDEQITTVAGRLVQTSKDTVDVAPGQAEFLYPKTVSLVAGRYSLKVLVRDSIGGRMATYQTGIEVPGPQGAAAVQPMRKNSYSVTGEVHKAGEFDLARPTTVMEALVGAGGFTGPGANPRIRILRNGGKDVRSFNFQEVLRGKNLEQNVAVEPGDIIVVSSNER